MIEPQVEVTFLPSGSRVLVEPGATVLEAARLAGITLVAPCGGRGVCGTCAVRVVEGRLAAPEEVEARGLARAAEGIRLACVARIEDSVTVQPLAPSRVEAARVHKAESVVVGVDLGTTNVSALAVQAVGGMEVGRSIVLNRQASWGADVLTRAGAALEGAGEELRDAAVDSVSEAIGCAAGPGAHIARIVIAGNSVMAGLLVGADLTRTVAAPYPGPDLPQRIERISRRFIDADVLLVPSVASFVGGDALAGAVHTGVLYAQEPALLVDIGTNAEFVLAADGEARVTSAPAGPAFGSSGISCGGPATPGAVVAVGIDRDGSIELETIGDEPPTWFSGAGLISAVAELRRAGHLDAGGGLVVEGPAGERVDRDERGVLRVSFAEETELFLSQLDIRAVQLAKAAVRTGFEAVLRAAGVRADDLSVVYIAGAFGASLRDADLIELGMVPAAVAGALRYVGNASLLGATAMALDPSVLRDAQGMLGAVTHVDIAGDPGFPAALANALCLGPYDA